ncbi:MAG: sigma-70 family RNA polymerase sigma factor [Phycisphaerales bacterium]|nr:sigma-70 family RNA polymerase sigma factor [Phycisphaerales bacterium]MCB9856153.1 sigma-70 family RNA polymerase sigma factor [Phycisphaerales bacterium]
MSHSETTCWTMIHAAAAGNDAERSAFASRYESAVRAYLIARWGRRADAHELEDATQDVFVECFRQGGALAKADPSRPGGFRAFLYGIVRNVALRFETKRAKHFARHVAADAALPQVEAAEDRLSQVFDRAWAQAIMRRAADLQRQRAAEQGPEASKRVELLRLRFHDDLPIRDIAAQWEADPTHLHREYAKARREFRDCLLDVMRFHFPESPIEAERECEKLLEILA